MLCEKTSKLSLSVNFSIFVTNSLIHNDRGLNVLNLKVTGVCINNAINCVMSSAVRIHCVPSEMGR